LGLDAVEGLASDGYIVGEIGIREYFYERPWVAMRLATLGRIIDFGQSGKRDRRR
jgi:hypothetical protein